MGVFWKNAWRRARHSLVQLFSLRAASVKCVRLHVKILCEPDLGVDLYLAKAQEVFCDADIKVVCVTKQDLSLPALETVTVGKVCDPNFVSAEVEDLFLNRDDVLDNEIVVYFVDMIDPPDDGCSAHPVKKPGFIIAHNADQWTVAHELGHVLGLYHVNDNFSLMHEYGTSGIQDPPPDLSSQEIAQIRASGLLFVC